MSARFFPASAIPVFIGDGPRQSLCPTHCRRRSLWLYAAGFVTRPELPWCEFGVGEGESFDWFALHKPRHNTLLGFDSFQGLPEPWLSHPAGHWKSSVYAPKRSDVRVVQGLYHESLARPEVLAALGPQIGLIHIDCDLYSSTREIFQAVGYLLGPGTVVIFDEFYGYPGWEAHEARAFREFVIENGVEFQWIARADFQVAVQIEGTKRRPRGRVSPVAGAPHVPGVSLRMG